LTSIIPILNNQTKLASDAAFGFQNIFLENPHGTIPARSTHYLYWRFLPLEVREYFYELPMATRGGAVGAAVDTDTFVSISGFGYDPRSDDPHADTMPPINSGLVPPPYQLLSIPSQIGQLSLERISLGRLPQRTVKSEIFLLRNAQKENTVEFQWEAAHPLLTSGVVAIDPLHGRVPPEGFVAIKLTVVARCAPCVVDTQVAVLVRSLGKDGDGKGGKRNNRSRLGTGKSRLDTGASHTTHPKGPATRDSIVSRNTASRGAYFRETTADIQRMTGREPTMPSKAPAPPGQPSPSNGSEVPEPPNTGMSGTQRGSGGLLVAGGGGGGGGGTGAINESMNLMSRGSQRGDTALSENGGGGRMGTMGGSLASGVGLGMGSQAGLGISGLNGSGGGIGQFLHIMLWFEVVSEEAFVSLFNGDAIGMRVPRPRGFIATDEPILDSSLGSNNSGETMMMDRPTSFMGTFVQPPAPTVTVAPQAAAAGEEEEEAAGDRNYTASEAVDMAAAEAALGKLFRDLLGEWEVRDAFQDLPVQPKIPYYLEMTERASLLERLTMAFRVFDVDGSGALTGKELKVAVQKLGLKARTSEVKEFMRNLDSNADGEVDLGEFLRSSMPAEVSLALEDALEAVEHEENMKVAEERRQQRLLQDAVGAAGGEMTADKAAISIQGRLRTRNATRKVALKKELAESAEAREEHAAASRLQSLHRAKLAKQLAKERAARKKALMRQVALSDPGFQGMVSDMMESAVTNLLGEVLHGEFNLHYAPKQYTYIGDDNPALPPLKPDPLGTFAMGP
jgi:hypothetical protein